MSPAADYNVREAALLPALARIPGASRPRAEDDGLVERPARAGGAGAAV